MAPGNKCYAVSPSSEAHHVLVGKWRNCREGKNITIAVDVMREDEHVFLKQVDLSLREPFFFLKKIPTQPHFLPIHFFPTVHPQRERGGVGGERERVR